MLEEICRSPVREEEVCQVIVCEVLGYLEEEFIWEIQERHFDFGFSRWLAREREVGIELREDT